PSKASEVTEMNNAIEIQELTKYYGPVRALDGLNLIVRRGEIFGFLGPNGAGKTTTIRCLLDLIRPSAGRARVLGIDPQADPVGVRAKVGYLPGELRLDENHSAESILEYLNRLRNGQADRGTVRQLADRLDLDLEQKIKNLSKGNKQKVGVVQALMHRPALLMLDEPTSGLDPLMQQEVLKLIAAAKEDGATVFFSSHVLSEVQEIAERVGIIRQGSLVEVAETADLIDRSLFRARVQFKERVDTSVFESLAGVQVFSHDDGQRLLLQVEGEMDPLIKTLSTFPVASFETERPSLEEVFLTYYE
ncbi:MAG TPA: ABC transporter ATP-binding protein, partial [Anaerolineae bacterium]|nr:ABC transporter ATP-binding protein [Anaerolineae bacterium]